MGDQEESNLHNWGRKLLIVAFGGWAAVVAVYGQTAINRIDKVSEQLQHEKTVAYEYHATLERRVTILEQQNVTLNRTLARIEVSLDKALENEHDSAR